MPGLREGDDAIHIVTDHVHPDEPCHGLREGPERRTMGVNGAQEMRWVQKLFVIRGDAIAKFETDFGPASDFPRATPFIYPSFGENSVAQLQELAERDRHSDKWWRRRQEMRAASTLMPDIVRQMEVGSELIRNRSHFGPGGLFQRNGYPRQAAREREMERRRGKHP